MDFKQDLTFKITGSYDNDPTKGMISNESPIGKALIGKKVGEIAEVEIPATGGKMSLKVLNIEY